MNLRIRIISFLLSLASMASFGQEAVVDSLDQARLDSLAITEADDFVTASILVATPSEVLYTCLGHACIRMQCPHYDLDVVYTYESEDVTDKVLTFLMGNLKMGMTALPTEPMVAFYASQGRGVTEYVLNLPLEKRKQLWRYLDEKVEEGMNLPYDYLYRGCVVASLRAIRTAVLPDTISFGEWDEKFTKKTLRTLIGDQTKDFPWNRFFIFSIGGTVGDESRAAIDKVVTPSDFVEVLHKATLNGQPILKSSSTLVNQTVSIKPAGWFTPMTLACILLMFAIFSCFWMQRPLSILLLALQSVLGLLLTYLIVFSKLPATEFNWLIIPFNLLPLLLWHWRRWWLLYFAMVYLGWSVVMLTYKENPLVDRAYIVIVLSLIVNYIGQWLQLRKQNKLNK